MEILRNPDSVKVISEERISYLINKGTSWENKNIRINFNIKDKTDIVLEPTEERIKIIKLRFKGDNSSVISVLNDGWGRTTGDIFFQAVQPEKILPWYFNTFDGKVTDGYGVKTGCNSLCFFTIDKMGISLYLDIRSGGRGLNLKNELLLATIVERKGKEEETPYFSCRDFCRMMCDNKKMPDRPVFGANNWYYAYGNITKESVIDDAKIISQIAKDALYKPYMLIDDGWQLCRTKNYIGGPWVGNIYFNDMEDVAKEIENQGCIPGIWFRPLLTSCKLPYEFLIKNNYNHTEGIIMDPSNPDVLEKIKNDTRKMSHWGYKLIKHDFTTIDMLTYTDSDLGCKITDDGWSFYDDKKTTAQIAKDLYGAIKEGAEDALVMSCNAFNHLTAGISEIQRSGGDTSGRVWEITRQRGINTLAMRLCQNKNFFMTDADCVGFTKKVPYELNIRFAKLLAMSGTPLFSSIDKDILTKKREKELAEIYKLASQDDNEIIPLDFTKTSCPTLYEYKGKKYEFDWFDIKEGVTPYSDWFSEYE